jgi:hypothetical protein
MFDQETRQEMVRDRQRALVRMAAQARERNDGRDVEGLMERLVRAASTVRALLA